MEFRNVFFKQPSHVVFVDLCPPMTKDSVRGIFRAMNNILGLAVGIRGTPRLNTFGLYLLNEEPICVFDLQMLKPNSYKLQGIDELAFDRSRSKCSEEDLKGCFGNAVEQYERFYEFTMVRPEDRPELHLTVITAQNSDAFEKSVRDALPTDKLDCIGKVDVLVLMGRSTNPSLFDINKSASMSKNLSSQGRTALTLTEKLCIPDDQYALEKYFKFWLLDMTNDTEYVRIVLPRDVTVLCDMHEFHLDKCNVPDANSFIPFLDMGVPELMIVPQMRREIPKVPIDILDAVGLVRKGGICETIVSGQPILIGPSLSKSINLTSLETNCQIFEWLNKFLLSQQMVLVLQKHKQKLFQNDTSPKGYFVLTPTHGSSGVMIMKQLACRENMLPVVPSILPFQPASEELVEELSKSLGDLEIQKVFNPLSVESGLYENLLSKQSFDKPKRVRKRASKKKIPVPNKPKANAPPEGARVPFGPSFMQNTLMKDVMN